MIINKIKKLFSFRENKLPIKNLYDGWVEKSEQIQMNASVSDNKYMITNDYALGVRLKAGFRCFKALAIVETRSEYVHFNSIILEVISDEERRVFKDCNINSSIKPLDKDVYEVCFRVDLKQYFALASNSKVVFKFNYLKDPRDIEANMLCNKHRISHEEFYKDEAIQPPKGKLVLKK